MFFFGQEIRGDLMVGGHKISRDSLVTEKIPENNRLLGPRLITMVAVTDIRSDETISRWRNGIGARTLFLLLFADVCHWKSNKPLRNVEEMTASLHRQILSFSLAAASPASFTRHHQTSSQPPATGKEAALRVAEAMIARMQTNHIRTSAR